MRCLLDALHQPQGGFRDQLVELINGLRLGEQVSLQVGAVELHQRRELFPGFDTLGDDDEDVPRR